MFCPKCGTQNQDTDRYCKNCRNPLPTATAQPQQSVPSVRTQLPGVACHYPGCTEPVIGQCPGYRGGCLRYYCATHSIEPYCSVCADKILRDAAIKAMYEDYLEAAKKIPKGIGVGSIIVLIPLLASVAGGCGVVLGGNFETVFSLCLIFLFIGGMYYLVIVQPAIKEKKIAEVAAEKPGFKKFYMEYEKQKSSESMATVLTGLLVAGAAANAIQTYQMRQDIHEIVKKMKS